MSSARDARVSLHFKVPYWTQWGQNLVVLLSQGSDGTKRHALSCMHQGEELVWEGETQVSASARGIEYSYAIIDEADEIEAEEVSRRALALPDGLADGSVIELRDSWQVGDCGRFLPKYSAPFMILSSMALKQGEKISVLHRTLRTQATCCPVAPSEGTFWGLSRAPQALLSLDNSPNPMRLLLPSGCGTSLSLLSLIFRSVAQCIAQLCILPNDPTLQRSHSKA